MENDPNGQADWDNLEGELATSRKCFSYINAIIIFSLGV